jgi:hypothetical protein
VFAQDGPLAAGDPRLAELAELAKAVAEARDQLGDTTSTRADVGAAFAFDLQAMAERQRQAVQTLGSISKQLNDAAAGGLPNLRA